MKTRHWARQALLPAGLALCLGAGVPTCSSADTPADAAGSQSSTSAAEAEVQARLKAANEVFSRGEFAPSLAMMAEAVALATRTLGPEAEATLQARLDHASTRYHMGQLAEARVEMESVLEALQRRFGDRYPLTLDALNNYANLLSSMDGPRAALVIQRRALAARLKLQGREHEYSIHALNDVAVGMMFTGELHQALPLALEVLELRQRVQGDTNPWTFTAVNNLGFLYSLMGRSEAARRLHEQALSLRLKHLGEQHPETLVSMNNLAFALAALGEREQALQLLGRAIELFQAGVGPDHFSALDARQNRASIWMEQERWAEAAQALEEVLAARLRVQSDKHPKRLAGLITLAQVQMGMDNYEAARAALDQAQQGLQASLGEQHPLFFKVQQVRGQLLLRMGQAEAALALLQTAQQRTAAVYGEDFETALSLRDDWARALLGLGQAAAAEPVLEQGLQALDRLRAALPLQDAEARQRWQAHHAKTYRLLMQARLARGDIPGALASFEQARVRGLGDMLDDRDAALAAGVPAERWQALQETRERVGGLGQLLQRANKPDERGKLLAARSAGIAAASAMQAQLAKDYPRYADLGQAKQANHASAGLPRPEPGASWLAYATLEALDGSSAARLGAFVHRHGQPTRWVELGPVAGLADTVQALRQWTASMDLRHPLDAQGKPGRILRERDAAALPQWRLASACDAAAADACRGDPVWGAAEHATLREALAQRLLEPLQTLLQGSARWWISNDALLAGLPWDLLPWQGQLLGAQVTVSLPAGFGAQGGTTAHVAKGLSLWAIGDPSFEPAARGATRQRSLRGQRALRLQDLPQSGLDAQGRVVLEALDWARLPAAAREMQNSARHFEAAGGRATLVQGARATETSLRQASARGELARADVLLFSSHAFFNPRQPLLSAVVLGREGADALVDGYVTPAEFTGLRLDAMLTVLSACSTAQGATEPGDAGAGFAYALRLAGSRQSLLTLWPVHDQVTAAFVASFMARLSRGQSAASALQATKRSFIRHPRQAWRQPQHWAGFVLYGE